MEGSIPAVPARLRQKRFAMEEQEEELERVLGRHAVEIALHAGHAECCGQVDLQELFGA